ncbi:MAG: prepilin-type N-terminal cleavage/methylation domain-containing protein [Pseudomonadales bacterium]|nr:prepilin-type N-terminal cleavage/methylation domain-containing protein [Pseudomonadales bacterium]
MKKIAPLTKSTGFSIIEMIVAIVVSSIIAIGIVDFIGRSAEGVSSTANRNQLATTGRTAVDRLAMEIHNALPKSFRATTATAGGDQCLEFIPTHAATNYVNPSFRSGGSSSFDIVDIYFAGLVVHPTTTPPKYAVIYPNRLSRLYDGDNGASTGWPNFPTNRRPIQEISSIADNASVTGQSTVTLVTSHRFRRRSPTRRFFVVEDPISYCVVGDKLYRYTNYGFFATQVTQEEESGVCEKASDETCLPNFAAAPDKMLITDNIDNTGLTAFTIGTQTLTRNSLVAIELNFTSDGDTVTLNHEVLTRSVP